MASRKIKKNFIPLSSDEDEDEPIYQPFSTENRNRLNVPNFGNGYRRSTSLSPIAQSPASTPSPRIPSDENGREFNRSPTPSRGRSPTPSGRYERSQTPSSTSAAAASRREENSIIPQRKITPHLEYCTEEDCDICEILKSQKRSSRFFVSTGEVADPSIYNPKFHTLEKPTTGQKRSKSVDPTRQSKSPFSKKLAQLDATMRIIAVKVNQNVWEEKYSEAAELQHVLIWLRKVNNRLKKLMEQRSKFINKLDFKGAQKAKDDYETALKEAVDLSSIQTLLSPTEDGRTESYRAATMYRIDPNEENIKATSVPNEKAGNTLESPETVRTRCCGLCKSSKKSKKQSSSKLSPKIDIIQSNEPSK